MKNTTVQTLKGFRDFLPTEKRQRVFIQEKMTTVFQRFGFSPLETPTLEYASLLLGKYGTEADQLIYRFTDRGDREVGLRYDQTVPTARVLAQYQGQLPKYFRRYQIQNVFRADKPQKGRYREFTQCDCDIFNTSNPLADAELLAVFAAVYQEIGLSDLIIQINDRQTLLATLSPFTTEKVNVFSLVQSIDKLDKISPEEVVAELVGKGTDKSKAEQALTAIAGAVPSENLQQIITAAVSLGVRREQLVFTPTLARGLDYYTGMIFEGRIPSYGVGSIGGGGRYDKLIGDLSGVSVPATGFGIGFDRSVEAAAAAGLIPSQDAAATVVVGVLEKSEEKCVTAVLRTVAALRAANIPTLLLPEPLPLGKALKAADQLSAPYFITIGTDELASGQVLLKDLKSGEQQKTTLTDAIKRIS